jgi:hypothetical protein
MLFEGDGNDRLVHTVATYWAARLLTQTWAQPGDGLHRIYVAPVPGSNGHRIPVTAYAVLRPDGRWALLILNKDPSRTWRVDVNFAVGPSSRGPLSGSVQLAQYGPAQYHWKADGGMGRPDRNLPPASARLAAGMPCTVPPSSLSVLVAAGPAG